MDLASFYQMVTYKRKIYLRETDATGVLYFSQLFNLAGEAFEQSFNVQEMIEKNDFLLPIVHAEADFKSPIRVGDEVEISLSVESIGTTSFTIATKIKKGKVELGTTKIVHVVVSKQKPIPIPKSLEAQLRLL